VAASFLLGGAEHSYGFDPCPHHDAALVEVLGVGAAEGHAHHAGSSDSSESHADDHGPCSCVGPCATPAPIALPATPADAIAVAFESVEVSESRPRDFVPPPFVPFLLPYAHAPPSLG
jgi:hypothetical protein